MSKSNLVYTYRIYPIKSQKDLINLTFKVCNEVHNLMIKERAYIYNKFILYVERCLISKIEVDEERFFKHNSPKTIDAIKKINEDYSKVDEFAIYNEQIKIVDAYNRYFSGIDGFPQTNDKKRLIYNTSNIKNNIQLRGEYIYLPKLGNVRICIDKNMPNNMQIKKAIIKADNKGRYYVCLIGSLNKKKEDDISASKRNSNKLL